MKSTTLYLLTTALRQRALHSFEFCPTMERTERLKAHHYKFQHHVVCGQLSRCRYHVVFMALFLLLSIVKGEETSKAPRIERQQQAEVTALVGSKLKVFCVVMVGKKTVKPDYVWTKDGKTIKHDRKHYKIKKYKFLKIKYAKESDSGKYKCTASNAYGTDSIIINVEVLSKEGPRVRPYMVSPKANAVFYATIGENITIQCAALNSGIIHFQLVAINYDRNTNTSQYLKVLNKPTEFRTESQQGTSLRKNMAIFSFNNISEKDYGPFMCLAGNALGYDHTTFSIKKRHL